jgi:beta-carotene ketolase (CrtO type)
MQGLPDALARCIEDHGGSILTDHEVVKINTKGGKIDGVKCSNGEEFTARKAVISSVDPRLTLNKWLDTPLDAKLRRKIDSITEPAFVGLMTHIALDRDPDFKVGGVSKKAVQVMALPTDLQAFRQYFTDMRFNRVPEPAKLLGILQHRVDPGRVPEGKALLYLWQFVPYNLADGGAARWDSIKEAVSDKAIERYFSYTTNLSKKNILGKKIISPLDFERNNQNMINGTVLGPSPALYQYMSYRPIPELGQYRTPVEGLYLTGQSSHPGGGVTLGGRVTAQVVLEDLGIDFDDVVSK